MQQKKPQPEGEADASVPQTCLSEVEGAPAREAVATIYSATTGSIMTYLPD